MLLTPTKWLSPQQPRLGMQQSPLRPLPQVGLSREWWLEEDAAASTTQVTRSLENSFSAFDSLTEAALAAESTTSHDEWMALLATDEPQPPLPEPEPPRETPLVPLLPAPAPVAVVVPVAKRPVWPPPEPFKPLPLALVPRHQPPLTQPPVPAPVPLPLAVAQERLEAAHVELLPEAPQPAKLKMAQPGLREEVCRQRDQFIGRNPRDWEIMADMFYQIDKFPEERDQADLKAARARFLQELRRLAHDEKVPYMWKATANEPFLFPQQDGSYEFSLRRNEKRKRWVVLHPPCFPLCIKLEMYARYTMTALLLASRHYGTHLKCVDSDEFVVGCLDSRGVFFLPRVSGDRPEFSGLANERAAIDNPARYVAEHWKVFPRIMPYVCGQRLGHYVAQLPSHVESGKLIGAVDSRHRYRNKNDRRVIAKLHRMQEQDDQARELAQSRKRKAE